MVRSIEFNKTPDEIQEQAVKKVEEFYPETKSKVFSVDKNLVYIRLESCRISCIMDKQKQKLIELDYYPNKKKVQYKKKEE